MKRKEQMVRMLVFKMWFFFLSQPFGVDSKDGSSLPTDPVELPLLEPSKNFFFLIKKVKRLDFPTMTKR